MWSRRPTGGGVAAPSAARCVPELVEDVLPLMHRAGRGWPTHTSVWCRSRGQQLWFQALPDKYGVHRRTVRQALANAVPRERKTPVRVAPKLDPAKGLIDAMLMLDLTAALAMPEEGNRAYLTTNRSAHLRLVTRRCVCLVTEPSDHDGRGVVLQGAVWRSSSWCRLPTRGACRPSPIAPGDRRSSPGGYPCVGLLSEQHQGVRDAQRGLSTTA